MYKMSLMFRVVEYATEEYKEALQLKDDVMRKPLGLCLSEDDVKFDNKRIHIGGYIENELVCGCSFGIIHKKMGHIFSVYVKQSCQNQGIGQQLMAFAEDYAKQSGVARLYVEGRKTAKNFYLKCGFRPCGSEYVDMNIIHQDMKKDIL